MKKKRNSYEIGAAWEREIAQRLGLRRHVHSGNLWWNRLDASGHGLVWSLKASDSESIRLTPTTLEEAEAVARAPGGTGDIPIFACKLPNSVEYVVLRLEDFLAVTTAPLRVVEPPRRQRARIPFLMRNREAQMNDDDH